MKLKLTLFAAMALLSLSAMSTESETVGKPVGQMTYPMWKDGCILAGKAALGEKIATKVGAVVETTHGKWKCVRVVADQVTGKLGAAWAPADK